MKWDQTTPVAILTGGLGGPCPPQIFGWPLCAPLSFFLISRLSWFGWHIQ